MHTWGVHGSVWITVGSGPEVGAGPIVATGAEPIPGCGPANAAVAVSGAAIPASVTASASRAAYRRVVVVSSIALSQVLRRGRTPRAHRWESRPGPRRQRKLPDVFRDRP